MIDLFIESVRVEGITSCISWTLLDVSSILHLHQKVIASDRPFDRDFALVERKLIAPVGAFMVGN